MTHRLLLMAVLFALPLQGVDDAVRTGVQSSRTAWLEAPMHAASDDARLVLLGGVGLVCVSRRRPDSTKKPAACRPATTAAKFLICWNR